MGAGDRLESLIVTPIEPPPCAYDFPQPSPGMGDAVAFGADLKPGTLLAAYRSGLFPMPKGRKRGITWWSPDPRGVLVPCSLKVSRSLRQSLNKYEIRVNTAFAEVITACGDPSRDGAWINQEIRDAYVALHELGWAHSIEAWRGDELAGGLYGVAIGGLFAGESMFHRQRDASKVALVGLVGLLSDEYAAQRLIDVQWQTPHLATLGVIEMERSAYLDLLPRVLALPLPTALVGP